MKALKRVTWGLPIIALGLGGFVLSGGAFGAMSGPDLPAPIATVASTDMTTAPAGVDGTAWEEMSKKRAGLPLIRVNGRLQVNYKGSVRGF